MDTLVMLMLKVWNFFMSISFPITYQGITYDISLFAIFLFTTLGSIALVLLFKLFE